MTFGRPDVDRFLQDLEPAQFDEWRAYYQLEPWGDERSDFRIARLALAVEMLVRGSETFWDFADFCPYSDFGDETPENAIDALFAGKPSLEVQAERLRNAAIQFNAAQGPGW